MGNIDFTLKCEARLETLQDQVIFGKLSALATAANLEYVIWYDNTAARFKFAVSDGSTITTVTANNLGAPAQYVWYTIFAWHDATANTINISVDDGTADSASHTTGVQDSTETFRLGSEGAAYYLDGSIGFVGIWKQVVASSDRTSIYRNGWPKKYSELTGTEDDNLVAWWNFDETSGDRTDSVASIVLTDVNTVVATTDSKAPSWAVLSSRTTALTLKRAQGAEPITSIGGSVGNQRRNTSDESACYLSDPLSAQTIVAGTFKGQMYCSESNGLADLCRAVTVFIVSNDASTVKKLVCADQPQTLSSEFPTTQSDSTNIRNRNFPASTTTISVSVDEGDRILITTGVMKHTTSSTGRSYSMRAGNDQSTDAPEDQTDANYDTRNPWFEFSQDITFQSSFIPRLCLLGVG